MEAATGGLQAKSLLHVGFHDDKDDMSDRKKKYLTAKYGQHQMSLIKKRLRVEMWMFEQLQELYDSRQGNCNQEVEIDLDELLDMDSDHTRKEFLWRKLAGAKQSRETIHCFIEELMQRAKTL